MFFYQETRCSSIGSLRGLLLSRNPEYFTDEYFIMSDSFMNYILNISKKLEAEEKENM